MAPRGRVSEAKKEISQVIPLKVEHRQKPPRDMPDEQATVWREVVDGLPAAWFSDETRGLLVQYCRHAVAALRISQLIAQYEGNGPENGEDEEDGDKDPQPFDLDVYDKLLKMQERESRTMASLATKLRFTIQSTARADKPGKKSPKKKPWES